MLIIFSAQSDKQCEIFTYDQSLQFCYLKTASALSNKVMSNDTVISGAIGCFNYKRCNPFEYDGPRPDGYYMWAKPGVGCQYHFELQAGEAFVIEPMSKNHDLIGDPEVNCKGGDYIQYFLYHDDGSSVWIKQSKRICGPEEGHIMLGPISKNVIVEGVFHTSNTDEGKGLLIKHVVPDNNTKQPMEHVSWNMEHGTWNN